MEAIVEVTICSSTRAPVGSMTSFLPHDELQTLVDVLSTGREVYPHGLVVSGNDGTDVRFRMSRLEPTDKEYADYHLTFDSPTSAEAWATEFREKQATFPFALRRDSYRTLISQVVGLNEKQMLAIRHIMHNDDALTAEFWIRKKAEVVMRNHEMPLGFVYFEFLCPSVEDAYSFIQYINDKLSVLT